MSRFIKPTHEQINKFTNESDAQLAYRLQNEEFKEYQTDHKNSKISSKNSTQPAPPARPKDPNDTVFETGNLADAPKINSQGEVYYTSREAAEKAINQENSAFEKSKNSKEISEAQPSTSQNQENADFLLAQKLQAEENQKYQKILNKRREKEARLKNSSPRHVPIEAGKTLQQPMQQLKIQTDQQQNPLTNHMPSTSTKIPGREMYKHTFIGDLKNRAPPTRNPPHMIPNSATTTHKMSASQPPKPPPKTQKSTTPKQSPRSTPVISEDEKLALQIHRAEIIEANKHIKSDKNQIIERIKQDREHEYNRQKTRGAGPRMSPSAVSLEDQDLSYQNLDPTRGQVVYYPPR